MDRSLPDGDDISQAVSTEGEDGNKTLSLLSSASVRLGSTLVWKDVRSMRMRRHSLQHIIPINFACTILYHTQVVYYHAHCCIAYLACCADMGGIVISCDSEVKKW